MGDFKTTHGYNLQNGNNDKIKYHTDGETIQRSMVGFMQAWYADIPSYTVMY